MSTQEGHQNIVEELLAKPDAALVVEEVRTRLAEEKQKRDEYYGLIHENIKAEFIVSPFDGSTDTSNRDKLKAHVAKVSGSSRTENNQFGSIGVAANHADDVANRCSIHSIG